MDSPSCLVGRRRARSKCMLRFAALLLLPALAGSLWPAETPAFRDPKYPRISWRSVIQHVPAELGNQELARLGLVDVTAAPFFAEPSGERDATAALQAAIDLAFNYQMVVYLPLGTYRISDTLRCFQGVQPSSRTGWFRLAPRMLRGQQGTGGRRPTLLLAPRSPGFGDLAKPKYVVHFWAPSDSISMNQLFVGIDIVIGEGNPGAVAIRHRAAQGSGIQDCRIDATHGLAGISGGAGSGGSHANIEIVGGAIGMDLRESQPAPTISGVTLRGQQTAILYSGRQALTAVGVKIVGKGPGPLIRTFDSWKPGMPHNVHRLNGQLSLVDSQLEWEDPGGGKTAIEYGASLYLNNVFVRGADKPVASATGLAEVKGSPGGWMHIREFAQGVRPAIFEDVQFETPVFLDGKRDPRGMIASVRHGSPPPPDDLQSRHVWPAAFPDWQSPGAANVKAAPYHAKGDGSSDDTDALQRAIDEHDLVFLPKGYYRVTRTLRLRPRTRLVGVAHHLSWILVRAPEGEFADPQKPRPAVLSADSADADTILAFVGIWVAKEAPGAVALEWRSGAKSIVRNFKPWLDSVEERRTYPLRNHPAVAVTGNGGGRWYNFFSEDWQWHGPGFRHLVVRGTTEPLRFYQCNPEHSRGEANMEIINARNVDIFGLKGEGNYPILWVRDSDNIRVLGYGGIASAYPNNSLLVVERTPNFLLANLVDTPRWTGMWLDVESDTEMHSAGRAFHPTRWRMVKEITPGGGAVKTQPLDRPVLYRRGTPRGAPESPPFSHSARVLSTWLPTDSPNEPIFDGTIQRASSCLASSAGT